MAVPLTIQYLDIAINLLSTVRAQMDHPSDDVPDNDIELRDDILSVTKAHETAKVDV